MGRKRFIDKKNSVSFHLLHRSQRDPLVADESAPQRVLAEAIPSLEAGGVQKLSQRQVNAKYGVFFDDDYDYLQHLKSACKDDVVWVQNDYATKRRRRGGKGSTPAASAIAEEAASAGDSEDDSEMPALQLPSSVFASTYEEKVGLLNRAAPDHGLPTEAEAELAEVMDDDYKPEEGDELEDNFFELAGGMPSGDEDAGGDDDIEAEIDSDDADGGSDRFDGEDPLFDRLASGPGRRAKSVFTEYSTTSQGVLSTVAMEALNERFENFMGQYEDLEVGALETEDICGTLEPDSERLMALADDFQKSKEKPTIEKDCFAKEIDGSVDDGNEDLVYLNVYESCRREDRMDCESILSTYSTSRNRPGLIDGPPSRGKIRIGKDGRVLDDAPKLTKRALVHLETTNKENHDSDNESDCSSSDSSVGHETLVSRISVLSVRPHGELPEERRARKQELKALRRERIQEKKANRMLTKIISERQTQSQEDKKKHKQGIRYT